MFMQRVYGEMDSCHSRIEEEEGEEEDNEGRENGERKEGFHQETESCKEHRNKGGEEKRAISGYKGKGSQEGKNRSSLGGRSMEGVLSRKTFRVSDSRVTTGL
jgi:hypothetical protein